jgi:hypothetical protein
VLSILSHLRDIDVKEISGRCCPCCRIVDASASFSIGRRLFRSLWGFGLKASPQIPLDDFTSSRAQVNCLNNAKRNRLHAVRAVLHLNLDDYVGLEDRAAYCLHQIMSSLVESNKVGVTS